MKRFFSFLALSSLLFLGAGGCEKYQLRELEKFGNQEKLWQLTTREQLEEPMELGYAKDTPAIYRDASMGKADPSFVPRVSGG